MEGVTLLPVELLDPTRHSRAGFSCGIAQLDNFLQQKARKEAPELSLTFVLTCSERPGAILGYYTLSATKLETFDIPEAFQKKLGKYDGIPATLLGRLATATEFQKNKTLHIGETLVMDAFFRAYKTSLEVASSGIIVDVLKTIDNDPTYFYIRYGFIECQQTENRTYIPMNTIRKLLQACGSLI